MLPGVEEIHQGEEQHNSQFPAEVFFLREKNVYLFIYFVIRPRAGDNTIGL